MSDTCIFCKIVQKEVPSHVIWEDEEHVAFLSIFPNTKGVTVVIPKTHQNSYFADVSPEVLEKLMAAARTVAKQIDTTYPDVGRTGLVFEGFGVDHLHAKLFPLHGTTGDEWQKRTSSIETYFETYPGYISSHDAARKDDEVLAKEAEELRTN